MHASIIGRVFLLANTVCADADTDTRLAETRDGELCHVMLTRCVLLPTGLHISCVWIFGYHIVPFVLCRAQLPERSLLGSAVVCRDWAARWYVNTVEHGPHFGLRTVPGTNVVRHIAQG